LNKKNVYLWSKNIVSGTLIPLLWFSAKTYYEENGSNVDQWVWHDPYIHDKSIEDILVYLKKYPPNFFGFSVYVWSHVDADQLAKKIRELYPKCLIVYGGPHNDIKYSLDFFIKKPWVDLVVPSDVYGEPIMTHILDHFENLVHSSIPEMYYHKKGMIFRSKHELKKREFVWPKNVFQAQDDYFKFERQNSMAIYETTRGCPYRCIYCDWGGGTYTKVTKKPTDTIYSELESLSKAGIEWLSFADANFGIYKEDIKIIEHIIDLKNKYGYPLAVHLENAKNNLDRVIEIQRLLIKNNLTQAYKISIQSPDETVKANIDRVDIPFSKYIDAITTLKQEFNAPILLETILGLPGDTYELTLSTIDLVYEHDFASFRPAVWQLLPEAPAYDPNMRSKFQIETQQFEIYNHPFRYKSSHVPDENVRTLRDSSMVSENVVSTYSYTRDDWCDMVIVSMLSATGKPLGTGMLIDYLIKEHNFSAGKFYDIIYKKIILANGFGDENLNDRFLSIKTKLKQVANSDQLEKLEFDISPSFPLILSMYVYVSFLVMLYPKSFFGAITNYFAKELADNKLIDLGHFLTNIMIDLDYNPKTKRTFNTKYNWYSYLTSNQPLTPGNYEYKILDTLLKFKASSDFEVSDYPDQTDKDQKIKQFFYHRASDQSRKKYAEHIVENKL
jgi:putative methyltransferase